MIALVASLTAVVASLWFVTEARYTVARWCAAVFCAANVVVAMVLLGGMVA